MARHLGLWFDRLVQAITRNTHTQVTLTPVVPAGRGIGG